jgi:transposase
LSLNNRIDIVPKEAFVRLVYAPGSQMQIDFKDVFLRINGDNVKHHLFTARLCYSGSFFAYVFRSEDTPSLLEGIVLACTYFGGSARECVFDNAKTTVKRVLPGRQRDVGSDYRLICGSFGMQMHFAAPAKGNEKGAVEGTHAFIEDNFFRPTRSGENLKSINEELRLFCIEDGDKKRVPIDEEKTFLNPLPSQLPNTARTIAVKINKFGLASI